MKKGFRLSLGDTMVFYRSDGNKEINRFVFTGFMDGIHPFHEKIYRWTDEMLESVGIRINRKEFQTVDDMGDESQGMIATQSIDIPNNLKKSEDGNTYYLIYDTEMGRGWSIFLKLNKEGKREVIMQNHRDNIRDFMLEK